MSLSKDRKAEAKSSSKVFTVIGIAIIVFLTYWLLILRFFPTWVERGLFGDSFGALNTLISGLALLGVVYALYLQQRQLHEMRRSVELQQQPVISIAPVDFIIDKPTVFTAPENPACIGLSRFRCKLTLSNVSDMPAINLLAGVQLVIPTNNKKEVVTSIGHHYSLVTEQQSPLEFNALLVPQESLTSLFEVLRKKDAFALPKVTVRILYKNLMGSCFQIQQSFHVVARNNVDDNIRIWHAAISSFDATYQEDLVAMKKDKTTPGAFERIKNDFNSKVGKDDKITLELITVPGAFSACTITEDTYEEFLKSIGLPRLTFAHTTCPQDAETK